MSGHRIILGALVILTNIFAWATVTSAEDNTQHVTKYVRFQAGEMIAYGILEGDQVRQLSGDLFKKWRKSEKTYPLDLVKLLVPTNPSKVFGFAYNYKSHGIDQPNLKEPTHFFKTPSCLIAHEENIVIPRGASDVHYEAEMVLVIGKRAKNVKIKDALNYVLGVTCGNDVSAHDWAKDDPQWMRTKASETFGPCGPVIVSGLNYDNLLLQLRLNGKEKQRQRSSEMVYDVARIVSDLSQRFTLEPGDLIYTGTCGTTSAMKPGDVVEVELEGVGVLKNAVTAGKAPEIVSVEKIWDEAPHNAFTDLIRFQDKWFCTFREGEAHVGGDGKLRILVSDDGKNWKSAVLLAEEGVDLRDPKLSITRRNQLMIVAGGSLYEGKTFKGCQNRVAFSKDGKFWSSIQRVLPENEWLWRVTWHRDQAFGVSRDKVGARDPSQRLTLWTSRNGLNYDPITQLDVTGCPNETTLRFLPGGDMIALVRRGAGNQRGWIGISQLPYKQWQWHETKHSLGGPNFICLPDGSMWAGSRSHQLGKGAETVLARLSPTTYEPVLTLPSGGDCSYPGLAWHEGMIWMSYYSSHEGKSSIYLAKIKLNR